MCKPFTGNTTREDNHVALTLTMLIKKAIAVINEAMINNYA